MPIANTDDAREVEERLNNILDAQHDDSRATAMRMRLLFTETLVWDYADRLVSLDSAGSDDLPRDARLIASRDGFSAVIVPRCLFFVNETKSTVVIRAANTVTVNPRAARRTSIPGKTLTLPQSQNRR